VTTIDAKTNRVVSGPVSVGTIVPQSPVAPPTTAISRDGKSLYMLDLGDGVSSGKVVVFNTATRAVAAPISVGPMPSAMTLSPDGRRLYVANSDSTVSVIDTASNTSVRTPIAIGGVTAPSIAVSEDNRYVYATELRFSPATNSFVSSVRVFDALNNYAPVGDPIDLNYQGRFSNPLSITAAPGGGRLYVRSLLYSAGGLTQPKPAITAIDTASRTIVGAPIELDAGSVSAAPYAQMIVSPDGKRLYATTVDGADLSDPSTITTTITAIDTNTLAPVGTPITLNGLALGLLMSGDGKRIFAVRNYVNIASPYDSWVRVATIDTTNNTVRSDATVPDALVNYGGQVLSPDGSRLYLNTGRLDASGYGYVTVINTGTSVNPSAPGAAQRAAAQLARQQAQAQAAALRAQAKAKAEAERQAAAARAAAERAAAAQRAEQARLEQQRKAEEARLGPVVTAERLFSAMDPYTSDKLTAQLVQNGNGDRRMIVYMTGVKGNAWDAIFTGSADDAINGNITGWLNPKVSDFIDTRYREWKPKEIMLVGFSAGGQQMQNYAAKGTYQDKVKVVVTYGSPLTKKTSELSGTKSIAIVNLGDSIYTTFTHGDAVQSYTNNPNDDYSIFPAGPLAPHNQGTYTEAAKTFDLWVNSGFAPDSQERIYAEMGKYRGKVISSKSMRTHT
jgi:YVTN family beta-propeller protein